MGAPVCVCMPQVECPLHPDAAPTPEGVVLGAEDSATRTQSALVMHYVEGWLHSADHIEASDYLRAHIDEIADQMVEDECARDDADLAAERAARKGLRAAVEALAAGESNCWVFRAPATDATCTTLIGGTSVNGAGWTEAMCCLPCRLRAALAAGVRGE